MLIAILVTMAGCSDNAGETVRPTPKQGETPGSGTTLTIEARDFQFAERQFEVRQGQVAEIRLQNGGSAQHSFKAYEDDEYTEPVEGAEIQPVAAGQSGSTTLNPPEGATQLYFRCEIHKQMTGEIEIGL